MIKLSIKGLAKYMTSGHATQRTVLRDFKYPTAEAAAQSKFYTEAKQFIIRYVRGMLDAGDLVREAEDLHARADRASGQTRVRLRCNARAIEQYLAAFGSKKLTLSSPCRFALNYGAVKITIAPELHAMEGSKERLIRLEFAQGLRADAVKIIAQAMYECAKADGLSLKPTSVQIWDLPHGVSHSGARMGARLRKDIEAACLNIEAIWPSI